MLLPLILLMGARIAPEPAAVPYRQPQLAAAHGQVAMTFGAGSSIYFAASPDQGRTFSRPVKVAEVVSLALGRHRGPRLAILKNALVISAVVAETKTPDSPGGGHPQAGTLTAWRSTDRGRTWSRAGVINDVPESAREGLHAMAAAGDGTLFAAWLDLRARGTQLYGARSTDGGLTWSRNMRVYASPDGTICQCCHPSLSIDENGRVWAMWRNVIDGSRDLYATGSTGDTTFAPAQKLGTGTWKLDACPMDGGAFTVDQGRVISAWRRENDVFLAEGNGSEKRLGAGKDPSLARGKRGIYVAWTAKNGTVEVHPPGVDEPLSLSPEGGYVNLVALPDGAVLAAWETRDSIETRRVD